jgi:hypothetical protein
MGRSFGPGGQPFHQPLASHAGKCSKNFGHSSQGGGALLWSLDLKKPLSSNRINFLTKEIMKEFGIAVDHWKPHSTRGAGVLWWKNAGLQVEEVQQLGAWKNFGSFQAHYLRLGVAQKSREIMQKWVHKVSPPCSAEPEWSRTPGSSDPGGIDHEGEAPRGGEPTRPPRGGRRPTSSPQAVPAASGPRKFTSKLSATSPTPNKCCRMSNPLPQVCCKRSRRAQQHNVSKLRQVHHQSRRIPRTRPRTTLGTVSCLLLGVCRWVLALYWLSAYHVPLA